MFEVLTKCYTTLGGSHLSTSTSTLGSITNSPDAGSVIITSCRVMEINEQNTTRMLLIVVANVVYSRGNQRTIKQQILKWFYENGEGFSNFIVENILLHYRLLIHLKYIIYLSIYTSTRFSWPYLSSSFLTQCIKSPDLLMPGPAPLTASAGVVRISLSNTGAQTKIYWFEHTVSVAAWLLVIFPPSIVTPCHLLVRHVSKVWQCLQLMSTM